MEYLSQHEIDMLLTAINENDTQLEELRFSSNQDKSLYNSIEDFESFLTKRKFEPEEIYGMFDKDITMCKFFESLDGETILADIERKNAEQNMGNIAIPNTNIRLINYSVCPKCKTVFSFKDLMDYYKNPKPDPEFINKAHQIREDTRVCCSECAEFFLPALVIADGTPKNEVQFLCRVQTVHSIESFFIKKGRHVLTKNKANITENGNFYNIRNDVKLKRLESKPTLISNMLQYTPANLLPNLLDGSNIEKGDILFGKWKVI